MMRQVPHKTLMASPVYGVLVLHLTHHVLFAVFCSEGKVYDGYGQHLKPFPEVPAILEELTEKGIILVAASRSDKIKYW